MHGKNRGHSALSDIQRQFIAETMKHIHLVSGKIVGNTERTPQSPFETLGGRQSEFDIMKSSYSLQTRIIAKRRCIHKQPVSGIFHRDALNHKSGIITKPGHVRHSSFSVESYNHKQIQVSRGVGESGARHPQTNRISAFRERRHPRLQDNPAVPPM